MNAKFKKYILILQVNFKSLSTAATAIDTDLELPPKGICWFRGYHLM